MDKVGLTTKVLIKGAIGHKKKKVPTELEDEAHVMKQNVQSIEEYGHLLGDLVSRIEKMNHIRSSFVDQHKHLTELLKEYGDGMAESLATSLLGTWLLRVGDVSNKMGDLDTELSNQLEGNFAHHMKKFLKSEMADAKASVKTFRKLSETLESKDAKVAHQTNKKMTNIVKLENAEADRLEVKKEVEKQRQETLQILAQTNRQAMFIVLDKLCTLIEVYEAHFRQTHELFRGLLPEVAAVRNHIATQNPKEEEAAPVVDQPMVSPGRKPRAPPGLKLDLLDMTKVNAQKRSDEQAVAGAEAKLSRNKKHQYSDELNISMETLPLLEKTLDSIMLYPLDKCTTILRWHVMSEKKRKRILVMNTAKRTLEVMREPGVEEKEDDFFPTHALSGLLQATKSNRYPRVIKLLWKKFTDRVERYEFSSIFLRERFYEMVWYFALAPPRAADPRNPISPVSRADHPISLFVGSWNMGDAPPPPVAKYDVWIPKSKFDIYCIGVQECEFVPREGRTPESDWFDSVTNHLGDGYVRISSLSLLTMRLCVFIRRELFHRVTRVKKATKATGVGNVLGNKGAVAIGFQYYESRIAFVTSHLAAHQEKVDARSQDYQQICKKLSLQPEPYDLLSYYDYVIWCGDLNYRIDLQRDVVCDMIKKKDYDSLLAADQLQKERAAGRVFAGFEEAKPRFLPTYRLTRNVHPREYSDEKGRIPAYCDRVLWRVRPQRAGNLSLMAYYAAEEITTSDHTPIAATFELVRPHLPNPPQLLKPKVECLISITNLSAQGLRAVSRHGTANPYIIFDGWFLPCMSSEPVPETTSPQWSNEQVPTLVPFITNAEYLRMQHLTLIVRNHDEYRSDKKIGIAILPLLKAADDPGRAIPFEVFVLYKGLNRGVIRGRLQIDWRAEEQKRTTPLLTPRNAPKPSLTGSYLAARPPGPSSLHPSPQESKVLHSEKARAVSPTRLALESPRARRRAGSPSHTSPTVTVTTVGVGASNSAPPTAPSVAAPRLRRDQSGQRLAAPTKQRRPSEPGPIPDRTPWDNV